MIKKMNLFFLILLLFLMPLTMLFSLFLIEAFGSYIVSTSFLYEICLFVLMYSFLKMNHLNIRQMIGFPKITTHSLILSMITGLLVAVVGQLWVKLCFMINLMSAQGQTGITGTDIFAAVLLAPVVEELLFRGVFWSILQENKGTTAAIIVSTVYFIFLHLTLRNAFSSMLIGICGSCFILFTGSVIPAVVIHFLNNLLAVVLGYAGIKAAIDRTFTLPLIITSLIIGATLLLLILAFGFRINKKTVINNVKHYQSTPKVVDPYSIFALCYWMLYIIAIG